MVKIKEYLLKIDEFLSKHWQIIFFGYFIFAYIISAVDYYDAEIIRWSTSSYGNYVQLGRDVDDLLYLWMPLIIGCVWKKIFHPKV